MFFRTSYISFAIYTKFIVANYLITLYNYIVAEIAQSVEHFTRNEGVVGSSPIFSLKSGEYFVSDLIKIFSVLFILHYFNEYRIIVQEDS